MGWGANPAARGTPGGGSGGAIYDDGTDYNTLIVGTIMRNNSAREGGGAIFGDDPLHRQLECASRRQGRGVA
jgi:hypothetical protein